MEITNKNVKSGSKIANSTAATPERCRYPSRAEAVMGANASARFSEP